MPRPPSLLPTFAPLALTLVVVACKPGSGGRVAPVEAGAQPDASVATPEVDASVSCPVGRMACGGLCVTVEQDPMNCGTCGNECAEARECRGGQCVVALGCEPTAYCDNRCVELDTNNDHCGKCFNSCAEDKNCQGGECRCPDGSTGDCPKAPQVTLCGSTACSTEQFCSAAGHCIENGTCAVKADCKAKERCDGDTRTCTSEPWLTFGRVGTLYKHQVNGLELAFSYDGPISGMSCVLLDETEDPTADARGHRVWSNNYFCSSKDIGLEWKTAGNHCLHKQVRIFEEAEPREHTWHDNYLCYDTTLVNLAFSQSHATWQPGQVSFNEPGDPGWSDNYLIVRVASAYPCDLQDLSDWDCALNAFKAPTFPGGKKLEGDSEREIVQGTLSVHEVTLRGDARTGAKVTFEGHTVERVTFPCLYSYKRTIDVVSAYDAATGTVTLRSEGQGCGDFHWQVNSPGRHCERGLVGHRQAMEPMLCSNSLKLALDGEGRLILAEAPF